MSGDGNGVNTVDAETETAEIASLKEKAETDIAAIADAKGTAIKDAETVGAVKSVAEADALAAKNAKENVEADEKTIANLKKVASEKAEVVTALAKEAEKIKKTVATSETVLEKREEEFDELKEKIESLLPGATSAGLASAFRKQKESFNYLRKLWPIVFAGCMILLVVLFFTAPLSVFLKPGEVDSLEKAAIYFLQRVPLAFPLVWLGIIAQRQHRLVDRLAYSYGHKEALSMAFEGYKKQMSGIMAAQGNTPPVDTLCDNILNALAESPEHIYARSDSDATPAHLAVDLLQKAIDAGKKVVDGLPKRK